MPQTPPIYRARPVIYPARTGYGHVGEVLAVGPDVTKIKPGDRVLTFSRHASIVRANAARFAMPVPKDADGRQIVFTRMAGVAITALRASSASAGDKVAVIGLGLVGNLAAQLLQLAGCEVIAFDVAPRRLELARACGVEHVHNASEVDPIEVTRRWAGSKDDRGGARVVVEAIGRSDLAAQAVEMTGRHGEVVLLGSPRAPYPADLTPMLARIHLLAIKMIGALEWTFPIPEETERARHTIAENYQQILGWIMDGRLKVDPLRTHVLPPERCQEAYYGLTHHKDEYLGVVFDWTRDTAA
jgi:threonine dehydrogenase-like Zn-dependent dehydrogenase